MAWDSAMLGRLAASQMRMSLAQPTTTQAQGGGPPPLSAQLALGALGSVGADGSTEPM